jgi:hypothetical protein
MVGASALGLPFLYSQLGSSGWKAKPLNQSRTPLDLKFSRDEQGVLAVLRQASKGVYLMGGGVMAKVIGADLPYLNLVVESDQFTKIKDGLFKFGVEPISTPELPGNFIRFVYRDKAYSVINVELDAYLKQNVLGQTVSLVPLAHNFLAYSVSESWVLDPYEALGPNPAKSNDLRMKVVHEPDSPVMGLELCLAVSFESALLGLPEPTGHRRFEKRLLAEKPANERISAAIVHQVLTYFPDLMEMNGPDYTRKYLLSPLCTVAASQSAGVDLRKVDRTLKAIRSKGDELTSAHLVAAMNQQFCRTGKVSLFGTGIPDYMAANKMPVRRKDLLAQALSDPNPLPEV